MSSWLECANLGVDPSLLFKASLDHIIAYQPHHDRWYQFALRQVADDNGSIDWADCIFEESATALISNGTHPILFLNLDQPWNTKSGKGEAMLLDFLRYLRLSKYHPKTLTRPDFDLWRSPAVCLSFHSLLSFIKRVPEGLVLFAPSVKFQQLPVRFPNNWLPSLSIAKAEDAEIIKYVNSTRPVNLSSNHDLGDIIGPYSVFNSLEGAQLEVSVSPQELDNLLGHQKRKISTDTLHDILWQSEQRKTADNDVNPSGSTVLESVKALQKLSGRILIIDDKGGDWNPIWKALEGQGTTWKCISANDVKRLVKVAHGKTTRTRFPFEPFQLVILDLRLDTDDKDRKIENISGYKVLQFIRRQDEAIPILVFTSSYRVGLLRKLKSAGADMVCNKPARVETAPNLLETLISEISLLLAPEYQFLTRAYYALKKQEVSLTYSPILVVLQWSLAAWTEGRQNLRMWITQKNSSQARLSARSVIRTAGLGVETLSGTYKSDPYVVSMRALRNTASHIGAEAVLNTETAYLMIHLVTEFISSIANKTAQSRNVMMATPSRTSLEQVISLTGLDGISKKSIYTLLQLAMLINALSQCAKTLRLDGISLFDLKGLENSALTALSKIRLEKKISPRVLNPFRTTTIFSKLIKFRLDYSHLKPWFASMEANI
jgi:CheY-like chemotaxis protein